MEISFGKVSRKISAQTDVDELWSTIIREIPGLSPYRDKLNMRYIDDEGDDILVTTNDELQEALQVGKETSNGILSLNLSVTGMGSSTRVAVENTACCCSDGESTLEEVEILPPIVPTRVSRTNTVSSDEPDVIQILKKAGASAILEINSALGSASTEIDRLFSQLGSAAMKHKKVEAELAAAKTELAEANSKCDTVERQVVVLTQKLADSKTQLDDSMAQKQCDTVRLQNLECQVAEAMEWKKKCQVAEKQRLQLDQQLKALRSALKTLTVAEPKPTTTKPEPATDKPEPDTAKCPVAVITNTEPGTATAEVVSHEIVPCSTTKSSHASELPPPYEESVQKNSPPVQKNSPPTSKPAPSPLAFYPAPGPHALLRHQQMQQLREMGFNLTLGELNEKLRQHNDNMEHVVNSLL